MGDEGRRDREGKLMLGAYYFVFEPTECEPVDVILSRVAGAGKAYHSTEAWDGGWDGDEEPSEVSKIQAAANDAAAEIAALKRQLATAIASMNDSEQKWEAEALRAIEAEAKVAKVEWRVDAYKKCVAYLREVKNDEHEARRRSLQYADETLDLVEERTNERDEARSQLAEARDTADLLDFYFNHHVNAGGRRRWIVESPLGRQWVLLEDVEHHRAMHDQMYSYEREPIKPDWQMIEGPGERQDFPTVQDAIREARRRSYGIWDVPEEDDAIDAARKGEG